MKKFKKENKTDKKSKTSNSQNKNKKELTKPKIDIKINEKDTNVKSLQSQIISLKQLIESKNNEIEELKLLLSQKEKELINNENKTEKINKKLDLIKVRNDILVNSSNEKDQQIAELNNTIQVLKRKVGVSQQKTNNNFLQIKIPDDSNDKEDNKENEKENVNKKENKGNNKVNTNNELMKKIEEYELEINKIKNSLDESEIKNSKLTFENGILVDKIKNIEKEKVEEIKIMKNLHQKEIDNYTKNISQLNEKIAQILNEEEKNKNNNMNKNGDEYISKSSVINELNKKDNKIKELDEENFKCKKENQEIISKNEELKIICENKDKIIKKLEEEIEKMDMNGEDNVNGLNKDGVANMNDINFLRKENEELKIGLHNMTEGINEANELYNEKLNYFKEQVLLKNNKLNEYKNKIIFLKNKINELFDELKVFKGGRVSKNSYYNASFINNSIINTNSVPKYNDYSGNNTLMINKNYSNANSGIKNKNIINENKLYDRGNHSRMERRENNLNKFKTMTNLSTIHNNNKRLGRKIKTDMQFSDTQDFINKNKEEDKAHINFLKEYKEILNKFNNFN